jgi:hypothetical protein
MKVEQAARLLTSRAIMDGELHLLSCSSFESSPSRIVVTQKWLGAFADYHVAAAISIGTVTVALLDLLDSMRHTVVLDNLFARDLGIGYIVAFPQHIDVRPRTLFHYAMATLKGYGDFTVHVDFSLDLVGAHIQFFVYQPLVEVA